MNTGDSVLTPHEVPGAKQAGDVRSRWDWAEPSVWTERMLTALEKGVKGGVWFSLIDKVCAQRTLWAAFARVKANRGAAGVDNQTIAMFDRHLEQNLLKLTRVLRDGTYRPQAVRRVWIAKPGRKEKRPLGIPTVRDRVVQTALRSALEPIFERDFAEHSYGFRPNRSCKDALRRVYALLRQGYTWVVDADLKSYFDMIPHDRLIERVREKVADGRVIALIEAFLNQQVKDGTDLWAPEQGSPQGAVISPLLSNLYLGPLDHAMARSGYEMIRYADDFVILCRSEAEAREALAKVGAWTAEAGLQLHPEKTRLVDAREKGGFDFLGYHFGPGRVTPSPKSLGKFKGSIRTRTRRTNGHSLATIIESVNEILRGWYEYFKHGPPWVYRALDGWLRRRLRSILRKRHKRKGISKGRENVEWPNRFFAEHGLFSMAAAQAEVCQSVRR